MRKSVISLLLSASLVVGLMPADGMGKSASAAEAANGSGVVAQSDEEQTVPATTSGTFTGTVVTTEGETSQEDALLWSFETSTGVLTIGTTNDGDAVKMPDYTSAKTTPWFACAALTKKVVFTGGITNIGAYTFAEDGVSRSSYPLLTEVDITGATGLTKIGERAFNYSGMETLTGMEQLTELGEYAFFYAQIREFVNDNITDLSAGFIFQRSALIKVNMPNLVTISGNRIFANCSALKSVNFPQLLYIEGTYTFMSCSVSDVYMPKVLSVGDGSFYYCQTLGYISLPEACSFGDVPFEGCSNLYGASIPKAGQSYTDSTGQEKTATFGGKYDPVFMDCVSLAFVNVSEAAIFSTGFASDGFETAERRIYYSGEATIASSDINSAATFYVPAGKKAACIPEDMNSDSVTNVIELGSGESFADLMAKERIITFQVDDEIDYESLEEWEATNPVTVTTAAGTAVDTAGMTLTYQYYTDQYCTQLVNGENGERLPVTAGNYYVRIKAPATDSYFEAVSAGVAITLAGEIMSSDGKWSYRNSTKTLTIYDASVLETDYDSSSAVPWSAYMSTIEKVVLGDGVAVTKIGAYAFNYSRNLKEFDLPDNVAVGEGAFTSCSEWETNLNVTLTSVATESFYGCSKLTGKVTVLAFAPNTARPFYDCAGLTEIKISGDLTELPEAMYSGCSGLTAVDIPSRVTTIGNNAFYQCSGLTAVDLPSGVTTIGNGAFYQCSGLTAVDLPSGVTTIGNNAFYGCTGLTSIQIPDSVVSLEVATFANCINLASVELPESLVSLAERNDTVSFGVFQGCEKLTEITLPSSLTVLGSLAFAGTGLKELVIPETVKYIGSSVFMNCESLEYVEFENDNYPRLTSKDTTATGIVESSTTNSLMFSNVPDTAMVICGGTTYTTLQELANLESTTSWSEAILTPRDKYTTAYDSLVSSAEATFSEADYSVATWTAYQGALTAAQLLLETGSGSTLYKNQRKACEDVQLAAKILLSGYCEQIEAMPEEDYDTTHSSWSDLQSYLTAAKTIVESDAVYEMSAIKKAQTDISDAVLLLEKASTDEAAAALGNLIDSANAYDETKYTLESWSALQSVLEEVEMIQAIGTNSQINKAKQDLEAAIAALVEVGTNPSASPSTDPSTSPSTDPSTSPSTDPSTSPSTDPSTSPSTDPSTSPSTDPSTSPSTDPSTSPSTDPSVSPSADPGTSPSIKPSTDPSKQPSKVSVKKVTLKKAKSAKKKTLLVQWKKLTGINGYQIQIATNKKFKKGKKSYLVKKAKTTKKTIKKLKRKKTYYVRIRAYKTVQGKKVYGSWSKVKKAKIK